MPPAGYTSLLESPRRFDFFWSNSRRRTVIIGLSAVFIFTLLAQLFLSPSSTSQPPQVVESPDHDASQLLSLTPWMFPSNSLNNPYPTQLARDNFRNDTYYLTSFPLAAFTNKVIAYMHLIYLSYLTQRVPIIPPMLPPGWVPADAGMIPFGDIFNLTTLRANMRYPILEWSDVKIIPPNSTIENQLQPTDPALEHFGCWSTNRRTTPAPTWVQGAENILRMDMSFTRIPDHAFYNRTDLGEVHTTFFGLSSLVWPKHPHAGNKNLPLLSKSRFGQTLPPDQHLACFDFVYFVSSGIRMYEFEQRWSPAWNTVGTNLRWTQPLIDLAGVYLRKTMQLDEGAPFPNMITVHIRRNDWKIKCQEGQTPPCYIPVSHYQREVDKIQEELRVSRNLDISHVYVASDETDPAFWKEISDLGWIYFDHKALETVERLGKWYPLLIDKVALSMGIGFVGTLSSTFSVLNAMRVEDWNNGITALVRRP